jgi:hypothetical protein
MGAPGSLRFPSRIPQTLPLGWSDLARPRGVTPLLDAPGHRTRHLATFVVGISIMFAESVAHLRRDSDDDRIEAER